ncbi:hypothetical protein C8F04DRAFT_1174105 [Mycena alexandri]|uniref:Uncharacterized protein n=1 Tax=Mycena alexandri TaxID=1745969 RepID=A0AAD6TGA3_9AGAR|nr:hypothetical protein C8F04DRAFT_1174105 [Mycena alexandri]
MSSHTHEWEAILICPAGFLVASVGFSLSVLATIFSAIMPSTSGPAPIIHLRQAAAIAASARSPAKSFSSDDSLPRKEIFRLVAPKLGESDEKLFIDVEGDARGDSKIEATLVLSPVGLSRQATKHSQHVVHFKFPVKEIASPVQERPSISASPTPTHRSLHSGSSHASSEVNTLSSPSADSSPLSPPSDRRRHKLRFSKLVHLFTDKHGHFKARRRESVSELRADATPLSPTTLSPSDSMPASPVDTPLRSQSTRRPGHRSLIRTVSCPILHYTHPHERTSRSRSPPPAVPPLPTIPATPTSPVAPESPHTKTRKVSLKKEKEVTPRLRTQPYAAPYFIPPPDSVNVEKPFVRRTPTRRRTTETMNPSALIV